MWKKGLPTLDGFTCEGIFFLCFNVYIREGVYHKAYGEAAIKADETIWYCGIPIPKENVLAWLDYPEYIEDNEN